MAKINLPLLLLLLTAGASSANAPNLSSNQTNQIAVKPAEQTAVDYAVDYSNQADEFDAKKQQQKALEAIKKTLAIEPNNPQYLQSQAELADELSDLPLLRTTYQHMLVINPNNQKAEFGLADTESQMNHLDKAAKLLAIYLKRYPNDPKAWLEYADIQMWRGDNQKSIIALEQYRQRFGATKQYYAKKAAAYSSASWGFTAIKIINPLLEKEPYNYQYLLTRATAESAAREIYPSLLDLHHLQQIQPKSDDTKDAERIILNPLRSNITLAPNYWSSTDTIRIKDLPLAAQFFINPLTSVVFNADVTEFKASPSSGYNNINGSESATEESFLAGVQTQLNPTVALTGQMGGLSTSNDNNFFVYNFLGDFKFNDRTSVLIQQNRNIYRISPRSVSLGIMDDLTDAQVTLEPTLQHYIDIEGQYNSLSDNNNMWSLYLAPHQKFIMTQRLTVDLGVSGFWQSYREILNDGYYSPPWYQRYYVFANTDFNQTPDIDYNLTLSVGTSESNSNINRNTNSSNQENKGNPVWGPVFDIGASANYQIYKNWQLVLSADFYDEAQPKSTTYNGYLLAAAITRRL